MAQWLEKRASNCVDDLVARLSAENGVSSMSPTIYDTAWVSMIVKNIDGSQHWRFPGCFQYVLDRQLPDGGWESYASEVDGILNTMAALLAMRRHLTMSEGLDSPLPEDIEDRIARATSSLEKRLRDWNVEATLHVGFEILVPAHLSMLEQFTPTFAFRGRERLLELNRTKLAKFDPRCLHAKQQTTLIHSLEAFIGIIDFDSVRHHVVFGSMMASPSSSAAYLMHCKPWDERVEAYLEDTITNVSGRAYGGGGVPSAFPSTTFELTWSLSTLLESGFSSDTLGNRRLDSIGAFLEDQLSREDGIIGFTPQIMSDADDTSKTLLALALLGRKVDPSRMIKHFESPSCFVTFHDERDPSFSANCNVLTTLLHMPSPDAHREPILKATRFVCDTWDSEVNLSRYYPMMLLARCLVRLLDLCGESHLSGIPDALTQIQIPIILTQLLTRVLQDQGPDGSWGKGSSYETSAYALITLKTVSAGPWMETLVDKAKHAIHQASSFLEMNRSKWHQAEYIWIEKVTYSSPLLSQVYCLAALKSSRARRWGVRIRSLEQLPQKTFAQYSKFFGSLPLFSDTPEWLLDASVTESQIFQSRLDQMKSNIFWTSDTTKHQYLSYLPITWVATNNICQTRLSNDILWHMIVISMLVYQVDEYMEATIRQQFQYQLPALRGMINSVCLQRDAKTRLHQDSPNEYHSDGSSTTEPTILEPPLSEVQHVLSGFITYVVHNPQVMKATSAAQDELRQSLAAFLLAHITQIEDSIHLSSSNTGEVISEGYSATPRRTYYDWVHTTSADHTSCPFAFLFFTSLIDNGSRRPQTSPWLRARQQYLTQDVCRHLATMCRQYNDYGSYTRDRDERNLNSLDFPEFDYFRIAGQYKANGHSTDTLPENHIQKAKEELIWLAEYERDSLNKAMLDLERFIPCEMADALQVFIKVTDLYGQMYVARDLTSRNW